MRTLTVTPLSREKITQAYPLVRHSDPGLSLEQWCEFANSLLGGGNPHRHGIMTAISEQGYILGLFTYRIDFDLRHHRVLTADNFHAMDLLDPQFVASTLAESLDDLAREYGCQAIHTTLAPAFADKEHWLYALLLAIGHEAECVRFCKRLATP